jgi:hypothetical protein
MEQSLFILALQTKQPVAALKTELMCSPYKIRRLNSVVIQRHKEHIETSGGFRKEPHHATEYSKEEKSTNLSLNSCYWKRRLGCEIGLSTTVNATSPPPPKVTCQLEQTGAEKSTDMQNECSNRWKFRGKIKVMTICNKFTAKITEIY